MRILAIESSAVTASVAILTDDTLTAEYTINYKKTHSQTLLPMIDEICDMTEVKPDEFDVVAVSTGPGSFTGLRIGVATGKGIALATGIKMAAVPTLVSLYVLSWMPEGSISTTIYFSLMKTTDSVDAGNSRLIHMINLLLN